MCVCNSSVHNSHIKLTLFLLAMMIDSSQAVTASQVTATTTHADAVLTLSHSEVRISNQHNSSLVSDLC